MKLEQIYTGCLSQGAYYIESKGEVAIIDPLREIQPYLDKAKENNAKIKYVLETHFHADFVSGHVDLAKASGAKIVFGPNAAPTYEAHIATDGEILQLGDVQIKVVHTPGHTMESTSFLLIDENGKNHSLFTGDTLFIGDVGRPDLAAKSDLTVEDLASHLYDSLRNKIMVLEDDLLIYPAHGAGSACGKNLSKETFDTLGNQKKTNYALRENMSKTEFIKEVTDGLLPPPTYFPLNVQMNKMGYDSIHQVLDRGLQAFDANAFELVANESDALILDTRKPQTFANGFIPNSINIGIDGGFAPWVGALVPDIKQNMLLVCDEGREEEVITRLARVGYDFTIGYLQGGFETWLKSGKEVDRIKSVSAEDFASDFELGKTKVFDVRKLSEYQAEHVEEAELTPLDYLNKHMAEFPKEEPFYIHCAGGYRSMIASSILKSRGYHNMIDIAGGFGAIAKTSIPVTDYVCPSKLK